MFKISLLWSHPEINPINKKARSIPFLNPFTDNYGRVFFFSWFGFMIAFWSWYAFPPLLADVIASDIHMLPSQVANSNIIALVATLLVRLVAGPSCDRFGPRLTFVSCLLAGAVPTFLAGTVTNAAGLYALRFFIGILGGSFVPCQVWTTGFFDRNVVGTANALTGGLGNLGGGITYFVMPAVYDSLVKDGLPRHKAWRVSFVVPGILIVFVAACLLLLCEDTPTGRWDERATAVKQSVRQHSITGVDALGRITDVPLSVSRPSSQQQEKEKENPHDAWKDTEAHQQQPLSTQADDTAHGEIIEKPTLKSTLAILFSLQTLVPAACYFCTFGAELSINSILGTYYRENFPRLTLQEAGNWAAMFGLLNGVTRPLGGFVSDRAYNSVGSVWAKKAVLHVYGIVAGVFLIVIGVLDSKSRTTMFGLMGGMAVFLEGANGADFGLVYLPFYLLSLPSVLILSPFTAPSFYLTTFYCSPSPLQQTILSNRS
ncbi:MFS general substrate transporter [Massarina eburnea CBS 473.64]|uniref:Nitrate/nitrite transporter n=1 Tax=Massarina eburnea CBS 473.64 TaxID=1395130 RepID=A0A6A6S0Y6_9PLEO|nr:MFS general substrate transporter [Massarina eburnea CBS 473.64]